MTRYAAALFDLDGTLADSIDDLADCANHILSVYGRPPRGTDEYKLLVGDGLVTLITRILPDIAASGDELTKIRGLWMEHYSAHCLDKTKAYDGMAETLAELKKRGVCLGVVTNKQRDMSVKIVGALYGESVFGCVCGVKSGVPVKPDPYLAFEALGLLGVNVTGGKPSSPVLFIGDTSVDINTAINANAVPAGALWGFREADELINAGAAHLLRTPSDILGICL